MQAAQENLAEVQAESPKWVKAVPVKHESDAKASEITLSCSCGNRKFHLAHNIEAVNNMLKSRPPVLVLIHALNFPSDWNHKEYDFRNSGSTVVFARRNHYGTTPFGSLRYQDCPGVGGSCNDNLEIMTVVVCCDPDKSHYRRPRR